ncbi:hypothetical protein D3C74_383310 [compost metagenome]
MSLQSPYETTVPNTPDADDSGHPAASGKVLLRSVCRYAEGLGSQLDSSDPAIGIGSSAPQLAEAPARVHQKCHCPIQVEALVGIWQTHPSV